MSLGLRFTFEVLTGRFQEDVDAFSATIADASTETMDKVGVIVKTDGRAAIASAGFSKRWQNALRVKRYPERRTSINAALWVHHKIQYAGVFAEGATIAGKPLLWLPLSTTPKRMSGNMTRPDRLATILGGRSRLVSMGSPGGTPLLGARIRISRTAASRSTPPRVTLAALRRGDGEGTGVLRTIPLFFGVRETKVPKKISIAEICQRARDRIPSLYAASIAEAL
jgi:hypothetical protein